MESQSRDQNFFLTEDVIFEDILPNLPVKSLIRFRSVCTNWRCLVDNPSFMEVHLRRSSLTQPSTIILHSFRTLSPWECWLGGYDHETLLVDVLQPPLPQLMELKQDPNWSLQNIVASTNGLILLKFVNNCFSSLLLLWNPATKQYRGLPDPQPTEDCYSYAGFGFDSQTNEYKLVWAYELYTGELKSAEVLALGSGCRKQIKDVPSCIIQLCGSLYVSGVWYQMAYNHDDDDDDDDEKELIISFDFCDEIFRKIELPFELDEFRIEPMEYNGLLAVHVCPFRAGEEARATSFDIWTLKGDFWTKVLTIQSFMPTTRFLRTWRNFIITQNYEEQTLCLYDPLTHQKTQVLSKHANTQVWNYTESLVSV